MARPLPKITEPFPLKLARNLLYDKYHDVECYRRCGHPGCITWFLREIGASEDALEAYERCAEEQFTRVPGDPSALSPHHLRAAAALFRAEGIRIRRSLYSEPGWKVWSPWGCYDPGRTLAAIRFVLR